LNNLSTVDEYLANLPSEKRQALQRIRKIIAETIPDSLQRIAYKICVVSVDKDMVGYASQKNHLSFFTMSPTLVETMKNELQGIRFSGATIHFSAEKPLHKELIQKILELRYKEITS